MKISFIGCGNMGGAIIAGLIRNGFAPADIAAADHSEAARKNAEEKYGILTFAENKDAAEGADIVLLAIKPIFAPDVLKDLKPVLTDGQLVISIVAGKKLAFLEEGLGESRRIIRVMPNTPALIGQGMAGFCANKNATEEDKKAAERILTAIGMAREVPERLMDVVTSVGGSAPAFVYMFIEALADAAVLDGMPRDLAYTFAAQTVRGSAQLVLEGGKHPGELKDMVCSPGGTTIEGVRVLEERGFRSAVIEAAHAATEKSAGL